MEVELTTSRRWIIGLSTVGAANMTLGTLRQTGVIRHLPDPPLPGFDSNKVITSPQAFALGIPDAPVALSGLLANIPLALAGGRDRDERRPWLPVCIAAKAVVEVAVAGWYLVQMRTKLHAWCAYCLLGASVSALVAVLALREADAVLEPRRLRMAGAIGALLLAGAAFATMSFIDARAARHQNAHRRNAGARS